MKKILAALFVVLLLAGCIPALAVDDAAYVGTWIYKHDDVDPVDLMIEMIHLAEDHQAFYILQAFYNGKATLSRRETGTWKTAEDGIEIEVGEKYKTTYYAELKLSYAILEVRESWSSEKMLFNAASSDLMTKMADDKLKQFEENGESRQESGVRVPMGRWRVGEDIPAGTYSVRKPENSSSVLFCVWGYAPDDYKTNGGLLFNEVINSKNQILGKIELKEGWIVSVNKEVIFDAPLTLGF